MIFAGKSKKHPPKSAKYYMYSHGLKLLQEPPDGFEPPDGALNYVVAAGVFNSGFAYRSKDLQGLLVAGVFTCNLKFCRSKG